MSSLSPTASPSATPVAFDGTNHHTPAVSPSALSSVMPGTSPGTSPGAYAFPKQPLPRSYSTHSVLSSTSFKQPPSMTAMPATAMPAPASPVQPAPSYPPIGTKLPFEPAPVPELPAPKAQTPGRYTPAQADLSFAPLTRQLRREPLVEPLAPVPQRSLLSSLALPAAALRMLRHGDSNAPSPRDLPQPPPTPPYPAVSPLSVQTSATPQPLQDLRKPMYIPAVLRPPPTEAPAVAPPLQPLTMRTASPLELVGRVSSKVRVRHNTNHAHGFYTPTSQTQEPTRNHWRKDESRTACSYCHKPFSFVRRRHHCRRCGDLFCSDHVSHVLSLDAEAQFTLDGLGVLSKVCDWCVKDYEVFARGVKGGGVAVRREEQARERQMSVADGVPADWSWSSF